MNTKNLHDAHYWRPLDKYLKFRRTCSELGLSMSAIVNLLIDDWMIDKKVYEEAKMDLIRIKALRSKLPIDKS